MESLKVFFNYMFLYNKGRINRAVYILGSNILSILVSVPTLTLYYLMLNTNQPANYEMYYYIAVIIITLISLYLLFNLTLKRAYDINLGFKTALFTTFPIALTIPLTLILIFLKNTPLNYLLPIFISLIVSIAFIGFILMLVLLCVKSKAENEHGPSALDNPYLQHFSSIGLVLSVISLNMFITIIAASKISKQEDKHIYNVETQCLENWNSREYKKEGYSELTDLEKSNQISEYIENICLPPLSFIDNKHKIEDLSIRLENKITNIEIKPTK